MFELKGVKYKFYITSLLNLDSYVIIITIIIIIIIIVVAKPQKLCKLGLGMLLAHDGMSQEQLLAMLGWASKMVHQI